MKKYNELSKIYFINMYTEYIAYDIFLNKKYLSHHNTSIEMIANTCLNAGWVLNSEEKNAMIENAKVFAKDKYQISI